MVTGGVMVYFRLAATFSGSFLPSLPGIWPQLGPEKQPLLVVLFVGCTPSRRIAVLVFVIYHMYITLTCHH